MRLNSEQYRALPLLPVRLCNLQIRAHTHEVYEQEGKGRLADRQAGRRKNGFDLTSQQRTNERASKEGTEAGRQVYVGLRHCHAQRVVRGRRSITRRRPAGSESSRQWKRLLARSNAAVHIPIRESLGFLDLT